MKTFYTHCILFLFTFAFTPVTFSYQDTSQQVTPEETQFRQELREVNTVLIDWDMIRGEWMANNLTNIAYSRPLTERTFSEDFTVSEFVDFMPEDKKQSIQGIIAKNLSKQNESGRLSTLNEWQVMERTFGKVKCSTTSGRTYGDPHISTFDGKNYSFQTVGEFVLSKSTRTNFEVQSRQKASSNDVSLNIAAAMIVNGDRVAFYTNQFPDNFRYEPVRVNGSVAYVKSSAMRLRNGGVIRRQSNKKYVVTWPTGEQVMIDLRSSGSFDFMNINVEVPTCNSGEYIGLLGNANGRRNDDLDLSSGRINDIGFTASDVDVFGGLSGSQREKVREYLRYIASDYAAAYRVNSLTSLFDYGFGQNTATFTDLLFPRQHRSVSDIPQGRRNRARRRCLDLGIAPENMNACIFDVAFVDIAPEPRRRIPRATEGVDFKPTPNTGRRPVNSGGVELTPSSSTGRTPGTNPNGNVDEEVNGAKPVPVGSESKEPGKLDRTLGGEKAQTLERPTNTPSEINTTPISISREKNPQKEEAIQNPSREFETQPVKKPEVKKIPSTPIRKPAPVVKTPEKKEPIVRPKPRIVTPPTPVVTPRKPKAVPAPRPKPRAVPTPKPRPAPKTSPKPKTVVKPAPRVSPRPTPRTLSIPGVKTGRR